MNVAKIFTSLIAIGLFGAAVAQDEARVKIEVKTDDGHGDGFHMATTLASTCTTCRKAKTRRSWTSRAARF